MVSEAIVSVIGEVYTVDGSCVASSLSALKAETAQVLHAGLKTNRKGN